MTRANGNFEPPPSAAGGPQGVPFGRYLIGRRLGRGGMGEVFLAEQLGPLGPVRPVALKRMLPRFASDPEVARAFLEEMSTAALLNHPNIATTYDFGEIEGVYFLALEYVDGLTLDVLRERLGPLPIAEVLAIVRATLEALAHAHALRDPRGAVRTVVHSDVSPHNLMVSAEGAVKLLDFGLARPERAARGGPVRGKVGYVAPDQARGGPSDRRADLYAVGVVLYELLAGARLVGETAPAQALAVAERRAWRPLGELRPEAAPLASIVERALEPAPERRFQTAAELLEALSPQVRRFGSAERGQLAALVARAGGSARGASDWAPELTGTGVALEASSRAAVVRAPPAASEPAEVPTVLAAPQPIAAAALRGRPPRRVPLAPALGLAVGAALATGWVVFHHASEPLLAPLADGATATAMDPDAGGQGADRAAPSRPRAAPHPRSLDPAAPSVLGDPEAGRPEPAAGAGADAGPASQARAPGGDRRAPDGRAREERRRADPAPLPPRGAPDATVEARPTESAGAALGVLSVRTTPWSRVDLDGRSFGDGVVAARPVPAGRHVLTLSPGDDAYAPRSIEVEIRPGVSTRVFVDFGAGTVRIDPL